MYSLRTLVLICLLTSSCSTTDRTTLKQLEDQRALVTAKTVKVEKFTCEDSTIAEAVQNVFTGYLAREGLEIVKKGPADVVITGTITITYDQSASSKSSALAMSYSAGSESSFSQAQGRYVSGISCLAEFRNKIIADGSCSQTQSTGGNYDAPESMAQQSVRDLIWKLEAAKYKEKIWYEK